MNPRFRILCSENQNMPPVPNASLITDKDSLSRSCLVNKVTVEMPKGEDAVAKKIVNRVCFW